MGYKSEFLVHWTGKDICKDVASLDDDGRDSYLQRIEQTLESGLWMTRITEQLKSDGSTPDSGCTMTFSNPITCFTEVRLTQSREHTSRYGLLGFGFLRSFVIERDGAPVIYLRNGNRDLYTNIIYQIWDYLPKDTQPGLGFNILGGLCKGMSNPDTDDFEYLHEAEWRIVHNDHLNETKLAEWKSLDKNPIAYLPFSQTDLKLIIVPDEEIRKMLFESTSIQAWLSNEREKPVILSYEKLFEY